MSEQITLIGLTGLAGTGKDSAAQYLCREYGFVQAAFADPLRSMVLQFLEEAGIDHAYVTERHLKEAAIPGLGVSARALLQTLGTEVGRALHPDLWVRHLALRLGLDGQPASAPVHDRIVLSDVRFKNEAAWLRARGGRLIRLYRDTAAGVRPHASELQLLDLACDYVVSNNSMTLDGLHTRLDDVMESRGIERRDPLLEYDNVQLSRGAGTATSAAA